MTLREVIPLATRVLASNSMKNTSKATKQASKRPTPATKQVDIRTLIKAVEVIEISDSEDEIQVMKEPPKPKASKGWPPKRGKTLVPETRPTGSTSRIKVTSSLTEQYRMPTVKPSRRPRTSTSNNGIIPSQSTPPVIQRRTIVNSATTPAPLDEAELALEAMVEDLVPKVLPKYSYKDYTAQKACYVYTKDEVEADDLVESLRPGPVAMDMEWHVIRRVGQKERRTALVQVADTRGLILLIQVYNMARFPRRLMKLLEDADVPKLGANILNDGKKLFRDYGVLCKNLVELGAVAQVVDPEGSKGKRKVAALAKLVEQYCGKELEKGAERTSNWEMDLTGLQCEYAANDAHCSVMIYQRLLEIAREKKTDLTESSACFSANVQLLYESPPLSRSSSTESADSAASGSSVATNDTEITIPDSVDSETTTKATTAAPTVQKPASKPFVKSQHMRAYQFWHQKGMPIEEMCKKLSLKGQSGIEGNIGEPLKTGTVISYVIGALDADPSLPFDIRKLRELVQMEIGSWVRHREWILKAYQDGRGIPQPDDA